MVFCAVLSFLSVNGIVSVPVPSILSQSAYGHTHGIKFNLLCVTNGTFCHVEVHIRLLNDLAS